MNTRLVHQNLDTSFVDVSALIKYLRRRQFLGTVKLELNGYKAEINLKKSNQLKVMEHDEISGRISEGAEAFQRILIRSKEPGGSVNVYQANGTGPEKKKLPKRKPSPQPTNDPVINTKVIAASKPKEQPVYVRTNGTGSHTNGTNGNGSKKKRVPTPAKPIKANRQPRLPNFPFDLSNNVEGKAKQIRQDSGDWQTLLKLTVELLGVIDRKLTEHKLDFPAAFKKACTEISGDYPFLNPSKEIFQYSKGRIAITERVNETIFVVSICEALGRIMSRLGQSRKFANLHREVSHLIISLINKRKSQYDRFGMTRRLERTVR
ncbi:MAG: hypothetical protein HKN33_07685 [Pyrinomonadaceae bacterium]|nr:hypothetical protein [Pyrinomonadaceae bacterium]